ncbi:MAG: hypothetical protein ABSD68_02940 [Candidatus Micrarchaeales archaeon]|jgi:hypothetical protein
MKTYLILLVKRYLKITLIALPLLSRKVSASAFLFDIISTLTNIQSILAHAGPVLSAVLFIIAGIFYAIGQLFPASRRANFHATSMDILIGAIIVAVLSVASNGLAMASTQLLTNITTNAVV